MAKRKTLYVPPEERTRPEDARPTAYGYEIRCRSLAVEGDVLRVDMKFPDNSRSPTKSIDLARAYLPPNLLHPNVTLLKDRPELARIVVAVIDTYMLRQQDTKSTAQTAIGIAGTVIRALEYFWLNDIYCLKDVSTSHWSEFLRKYVEGGWYLALDLERRASKIDLRTLRLSRRKHLRHEYSCSSLLEAIGANLGSGHVRLEYRRGDLNGRLVRARDNEAPGESVVQQLITHLNNLVELPRDMRATSLAHTNPYVYAASLRASQSERTENFEPTKLALLLSEAYRWVAHYAKPILGLANRVYTELTAYELEEIFESRLIILLEAPETKMLEELLGVRISTVRRVGDWRRGIGLLGLMRTLLAACFVLLGVFNGRRKDEIQCKATGVYADGFECVDQELALNQAYFYCEKTVHDYRLFYINEISFKALQTLKALSDVAWRQVARNGGSEQEGRSRKLFCMPPRSLEDVPVWYDYSSDPGIQLLTHRATGSTDSVVPNAHMFRRAYAVVFHYRYENAELYALSQQLEHRDLDMTLHYVLDGESRALALHAARLWGDGGESRKARAFQAADLAAEVKGYGKVKLNDDVLAILSGQASIGGGFPRLVQRFARKLMGKISYDDADLRAVAKKVTDVLSDRGHTVQPFLHGNCNAGAAKPGARCYNGERLERELASPVVCGSCPYHQMKRAHLDAVVNDLDRQRAEFKKRPSSLQAASESAALAATEALVDFYRRKHGHAPFTQAEA